MSTRAHTRWHVIPAVSGLILTVGAVPSGAAGDDVIELEQSDIADLRPGQRATVAGGPDAKTPLSRGVDIDVGPDGTLYILDIGKERLQTIGKDGAVEKLSEAYVERNQSDGYPHAAIGVGADGTVYVSNVYGVQRGDVDGDFNTLAASEDLGVEIVAGGPDGAAYVVDDGGSSARIRKISEDGTMTTIAGGGKGAVDDSDGKAATKTHLDWITSVAVDSKGAVYFSELMMDGPLEERGGRIHKVTPDGTMTTIIDNGKRGFSGDGGPGAKAKTSGFFTALTIDSDDNLLFIDDDNQVVRRINPKGTINTVAPATIANGDELDTASDLAVGPGGDLFLAGEGRVAKLGVNADGMFLGGRRDADDVPPGDDPWAGEEPGTIVPIADKNIDQPEDLAVGGGSVYVVNTGPGDDELVTIPVDDPKDMSVRTGEGYPFDGTLTSVKTGADGSVYLAAGSAVVRIGPKGGASLVAGGVDAVRGYAAPSDDGKLASVVLISDIELASAPDGTLYVVSTPPYAASRIYELGGAGTVEVVAKRDASKDDVSSLDEEAPEPDDQFDAITAGPNGALYVADRGSKKIRKVTSGGGFSMIADFAEPSSAGKNTTADQLHDIAVHPDGTVYLGTKKNGIRRVDGDGEIETVAELDDSRVGAKRLAFDEHGNLYFSDLGEVKVLVRPAEVEAAEPEPEPEPAAQAEPESASFPWWTVWAAAGVVVAGAVVMLIRRRRHAVT